jgi:uncharacterized membrane protein YdcZ (DUF606 family)
VTVGAALVALLVVVAIALVGVEIARELRGPTWLRQQPWWTFVSGALAATLVLLLVATLALLRTAS